MSPEFTEQLRTWFRAHARVLPWRETSDPYAIMVSEFMLQQTQVATVIPYFTRWMTRFPTAQSLAVAHEQEVLSFWQGLGYYSRARNLQRAAALVAERFPETLAEMKKLPGMGDYTAGAILTFSQNARVPIVDANIARVLARLFEIELPIDSTPGQAKVWAAAAELLPRENAGEFNAALMELGALICVPKPKCGICPVQAFCATLHSGKDPARLPVKQPKASVTQKVERALYFTHGDQIALIQRATNPWRGMWTLPPMLQAPEVLELPLLTHRYGITRYRVSLEIYPAKTVPADVHWFAPREIAPLPIPSPYRRVLEALRPARMV